jgi:hypothetical protein
VRRHATRADHGVGGCRRRPYCAETRPSTSTGHGEGSAVSSRGGERAGDARRCARFAVGGWTAVRAARALMPSRPGLSRLPPPPRGRRPPVPAGRGASGPHRCRLERGPPGRRRRPPSAGAVTARAARPMKPVTAVAAVDDQPASRRPSTSDLATPMLAQPLGATSPRASGSTNCGSSVCARAPARSRGLRAGEQPRPEQPRVRLRIEPAGLERRAPAGPQHAPTLATRRTARPDCDRSRPGRLAPRLRSSSEVRRVSAPGRTRSVGDHPADDRRGPRTTAHGRSGDARPTTITERRRDARVRRGSRVEREADVQEAPIATRHLHILT